MKSLVLALLAPAVLLSGAASACPGLQAADGWIRQADAGAGMTAGYVHLLNTGRKALRITGASAPGFAGAELHRSVVENGMHRMLSGALDIPPGGTVTLEPGGWHLMLFQPPALAAGARVPVTLRCGAAASVVPFEVRAP